MDLFHRNTADAFFKEENRPKVVKLFKPANSEEEAKISKILQNFSITKRIANCTKKVNCELFSKFCKEANIDYVNSFECANLTGVIHRAWAHLAEAILLNDGYGLGLISESRLESVHKLIRYTITTIHSYFKIFIIFQ